MACQRLACAMQGLQPPLSVGLLHTAHAGQLLSRHVGKLLSCHAASLIGLYSSGQKHASAAACG